MTYELIITEKPSSAAKMAAALADGKAVKKNEKGVPYYELSHNKKDIVVASAVGHLYGLSEKKSSKGKYPVFDIEWRPSSESNKGAAFTKKYATLLRKLAKGAKEFTIATDYDIEGETIGLNIIRHLCKKKDANRMKFSTVTKEDLVKAYENKQNTLDWGQANAGETRHFLDWYYGINVSRALMSAVKAAGSFMVMSTGRVQGPALKMIVDKEKEIQAFIPEDYWQLEMKATKDKTEFSAWHKDNKIFDQEKAKNIYDKCNNKPAIVKSVTKREVKQAPPIPFDLGSLQKEAHRCFNIRPKETLEHAQSLYTAGFISYPRTSSQQLPENIGYKKVLEGLKRQTHYKELVEAVLKTKLKPNNGKKKDPAHPAIYPTGYVPDELKDRERKIYDLIVKRFFATFGSAAIRESMTVTIDCEKEDFLTKGTRTVEANWHLLYHPYVNLKEDILPKLETKEQINVNKLNLLKKQTTPPKRYTQSSIITELEKRGLGTKATRADIVENLFKRGYIEGNSITATELGIRTSDALVKAMPEIVDEELTRNFEEELEEIREKTKTQEQILNHAKEELIKTLTKFKSKEKELGKTLIQSHREDQDNKNNLGECPKCKKGTLRVIFSKKTKKRFVGCSGYPDCDNIFPLPQVGVITPTEEVCVDCHVPLIKLKSKKSEQTVCFNPNCPSRKAEMKAAEGNKEEGKVCPKCKEGKLVLRNGVYGAFFGCSNYPKCKFTEPVKKEE